MIVYINFKKKIKSTIVFTDLVSSFQAPSPIISHKLDSARMNTSFLKISYNSHPCCIRSLPSLTFLQISPHILWHIHYLLNPLYYMRLRYCELNNKPDLVLCYRVPFKPIVVNIFWPPLRSQHVSHDRRALWKIDSYSIKTNPYLHMRVGYASGMKHVVMDDVNFPAWDPH